jgi:hypothetical protein
MFPYTPNLYYVPLETKVIIARQTIVGYWIPNNNEIRVTIKDGFYIINSLCLGP